MLIICTWWRQGFFTSMHIGSGISKCETDYYVHIVYCYSNDIVDNFLGDEDYVEILGTTTFISMTSPPRRCFTIETHDDDKEEELEKLMVVGNTISHLIELNPAIAQIWIMDDDSKTIYVSTTS